MSILKKPLGRTDPSPDDTNTPEFKALIEGTIEGLRMALLPWKCRSRAVAWRSFGVLWVLALVASAVPGSASVSAVFQIVFWTFFFFIPMLPMNMAYVSANFLRNVLCDPRMMNGLDEPAGSYPAWMNLFVLGYWALVIGLHALFLRHRHWATFVLLVAILLLSTWGCGSYVMKLKGGYPYPD